MTLAREERLELYRRMSLVRQSEQALVRLVYEARVHGFLHLALGQEAAEVGACAALASRDRILCTHRSHGQLLARGADSGRLMAEILGRASGYSGGRGGEMHMAIPEIGVLATTGVVGAGLPLAVGAGLAARRLGTGSVVLCFFGDGALAQGTFHESLNLATLWRLPVIFLCEVNQYAEMSPTSLHLSSPGVANRAAGYGCTGLKVDGNDVEAVRDATTEAAALCRAGRGPVLLEAQTYLLTGHYEGASLSYRPRDEVAAAEEREPLRTYRRALLAEGVDEAAIAACDRAVSEEVARAVRFALASPLPGHEDLAKGVWAE